MERERRDRERELVLIDLGLRLVRITNDQVMRDVAAALKRALMRSKALPPLTAPSKPARAAPTAAVGPRSAGSSG